MRISIYQSFFRACLYSIHDIVVRRKRIKASSTCKSSFTSSQLHAFLSTKHQHPDYSIYTKLIQTSSTFSIRSDKQTHQWIGNKFNKGDVGKSSVLAAATSLFLEAFVPVTRSRTKDRTHPAAVRVVDDAEYFFCSIGCAAHFDLRAGRDLEASPDSIE